MNNNSFSIFKKAGSTLFVIIFSYILSFINTSLIAKFLGSELLGTVNLIISFVAIIVIFSVMGTHYGVTKYYSLYEKKREKSYIINLAFSFTFLMSLIFAFATYFFSSFIAKSIYNDANLIFPIKIAAIFIVIKSLITFFEGVAKAFNKIDLYKFLSDFLVKFFWLLSILFLMFWAFNNKIYLGVILFVLANALSLLLLFWFLKIEIRPKLLFQTENNSIKKSFLTFSLIVFLSSISNTILTKIDTTMVGIFLTTNIVGKYSLAAKFAQLSKFLLMAFNLSFASFISKLYKSGQIKVLERNYTLITKWILILTIPVVLGFIFNSKDILLFFGKEYIEAHLVLTFLSIGWLVSAGVGSNGLLLMLSDHEKVFLLDTIILGTLNIFLNFFLIKFYGMIGAALATGISISLVNILKVFQVRYYLDIFPFKKKFVFDISKVFFMNLILFYLSKKFVTNIFVIGFEILVMMIISTLVIFSTGSKLDKEILNKLKMRIKK